ncbi:MAG TPA: CHASE3 domain-containing protein [Usitatibacter sp.]|nr:CHASE3 domain-containing protein [Usitatibacter sp.]
MLPARIWLPLIVAVAISVATLVATELSARVFTDTKAEIGAALTLRAKILQLEKTVIEAETSQRGYLLTRKESYLEPFQRSVGEIRPIQREILDLVHDEKAERDRLTDLNALIATKLAEMERTVKVANAEDFEHALAIVEGDEGRQLSEKLHSAFAGLNATVSQQMEQRSGDWEDSVRTSRSAVFTAVGLNVVLIAILSLLLIRDQRQIRAAQQSQAFYAEVLESEVVKRTKELSSLSAYLQTNSEREKASLARELHDELGGILTPAKMDIAWLEGRLGSNPDFGERMRRVSQLVDQAIDLKRRIIENLRPSLLDHLGLAAALQWYVEEACKSANLECTFNVSDHLERLPSDLEIALYRVIQESLTNAIRHANCKRIDLSVERTDRGLALSIADDGVGIGDIEAAKKVSHGLAGMSHRVRSVNGTIDIRSAKGAGTRVEVFVPLAAETPAKG